MKNLFLSLKLGLNRFGNKKPSPINTIKEKRQTVLNNLFPRINHNNTSTKIAEPKIHNIVIMSPNVASAGPVILSGS